MDHVQHSFLGHFNPSQWDIGVPWEGDELSIETNIGNVKVAFDDETEPPVAMQSFFTKLFTKLQSSFWSVRVSGQNHIKSLVYFVYLLYTYTSQNENEMSKIVKKNII